MAQNRLWLVGLIGSGKVVWLRSSPATLVKPLRQRQDRYREVDTDRQDLEQVAQAIEEIWKA